jgi:hypothetical protein
VIIKAFFSSQTDIIRKFNLEVIDFELLKSNVSRLWPDIPEFSVQYRDEDNVLISLCSTDELKLALLEMHDKLTIAITEIVKQVNFLDMDAPATSPEDTVEDPQYLDGFSSDLILAMSHKSTIENKTDRKREFKKSLQSRISKK